MKEISSEMARYCFNSNKEVFKLYPDGTEALVEEINDILEHQGIFGMED